MQRRTIILIKTCFLILSAAASIFSMLRVVSNDVGIGIVVLIMVWVVSPYALFLLVTYFFERFTTSIPQVHLIGFVIALLMLALTLMVYVEALNHKSSTEGLIFIFVPLWLSVGSISLLGLCVLVAGLSNRQLKKDGQD